MQPARPTASPPCTHRRPWATLLALPLLLPLLGADACEPAPETCADGQGPATLAIQNARIFTGDAEGSTAEAMALCGEKILYVGPNEGLGAFIGASTRISDLRGLRVLPGLHDVHQHTLEAHLAVIDCFVSSNVTDPEAYIGPISRCEQARGTEWVLGWGHAIETLLSAERAPRLILDDANADLPVAIMEYTSHSTWVNTRALELLGIDANTPDPQGGLILHDADGTPNGILIDAAGEYPWDAALAPNETLDTMNRAALRSALAHNASVGITSAVDARVYWQRGHLEAYDAVEAEGGMTSRMVLSLWASPTAEDDAQIAALKQMFRDEGGRVRARQIKMYSDGLIENTTAALLAPYTSAVLGAEDGLNYFPEARMARYVRELQAVGFDAHVHAIGDRAVHETLNAIEATQGDPGGISAVHRLTHAELIAPEDAGRFASLGVPVDLQLSHWNSPSEVHYLDTYVGADRINERAWIVRTLWDSGATLALSSDYDVSALSPFPTMEQALTRGDQSLPDVEAVVRAYTTNAARIMQSEAQTGSLEVGKLGDFVVLNQDIFAVAPTRVGQTTVLWTVVGGEEVFRAVGFVP